MFEDDVLETTEDRDDIFSDFEETTEEEETTETEEPEEEVQTEETPEVETIDFKFLGETTKLPKNEISAIGNALGIGADEVVNLLQKGKNYGNSPNDKVFRRLAKANEMTEEEYTKFLTDNADELEHNIAKDKILDNHPDWDDEKIELQIALDRKNAKEQEISDAQKQEFEENKPFLEFMQKYPDVKEFPSEVADDIRKGIHPILAYESYLQKQNYEAELAKLHKAEENKKTAPGSLKDTGGNSKYDDFEVGLFG